MYGFDKDREERMKRRLARYKILASNPSRDDEDDLEIVRLLSLLKGTEWEPDFPPVDRK